MSQRRLTATPPKGLLRLGLRLPILLYRMGLGWLLGEHFLMLTHVGRKSGQARNTVVEVIGHDPGTRTEGDTYYIASGWGYTSNWYRNLLANPQVTIQVGRRRMRAYAETLPVEEAAQVLFRYNQAHPFAARELDRLLGLNLSETSLDELENVVRESLPVIALRTQTAENTV
jgi:deazaflavin-dependent oxidoreductase (nitroreductase family)